VVATLTTLRRVAAALDLELSIELRPAADSEMGRVLARITERATRARVSDWSDEIGDRTARQRPEAIRATR
jgi:hypothetical protein